MNHAETLARLKAGVYATYSLDQVPEWIEQKTFLNGKRYSFKKHEFQRKVLEDTSREVNCQKCSQIGMTEAQGRWALGLAAVFPNFSVIYTMPYSNDAETLCRTRIDPMIQDSPTLRALINPDLNNAQMKKVGNSLLYFRGTNGNTQAISIPADCIISDEIDRSDKDILAQYTSRLRHSPWKLRRNFSTPTVDGYGIALKMATSRRFRNMCKCDHCNHFFVPDYYDHVVVPGYGDKLENINKNMLSRLKWKESKLLCPRCGLQPNLWPEAREWVQENPDDPHEAAGYYISPFDAPGLQTIAELVQESTEYASLTEFKNQGLGLTAQDTEETLTLADLKKAMVYNNLKDSGLYAMGADMGLMCRICIGRLDPVSGALVIVHREKVPLGNFETRVRQLSAEFRCLMKVFDSLPYVDLIMRMQRSDANLYAALFVKSKRVEVFRAIEQLEDPEEGKLDVRQVQVNRNKALDELTGHIKRDGLVLQADSNEDEDYFSECLDLKRILKREESGEMSYSWEKSAQGNDHYYFATLYLFVAARMRGMATGGYCWPSIVSTFHHVEKVD